MGCGVGCRCGSDPALLWRRLAATALIRSLPWEPPYTGGYGSSHRKGKKTKKKKKKRLNSRFEKGEERISEFLREWQALSNWRTQRSNIKGVEWTHTHKKGKKKIFLKIAAENIPNMMKNNYVQIPEAWQSLININTRRPLVRDTVVS